MKGTALRVRAVVVGPATGGWVRLMQQEGIDHEVVGDRAEPVGLDRGAVVLTDAFVPTWAQEHLAAGGTVVVSGLRHLPGTDEPPRRALISGFRVPGTGRRASAPATVTVLGTLPGPPTRPCAVSARPDADAGEIRLHEDRVPKFGTDPDVFPVVRVDRVGAGVLVHSPVALTELVDAEGDRLRAFATETPVTERVSAVDKADVVDTMLHLLRTGFRAAGLPLVRLGRFPGGAPSVLILRVDVDGAFGTRTQALLDAAGAAGVPASFYVNGDLCEAHPGLPATWPASVEVGQHGQVHTLFDTEDENLRNLRAGERAAALATGRRVRSFVAPRGLWNPALGRALGALGYEYSSDFGLDLDSLPFRDPTGILQVPVHPFSPERAARWADESGVQPMTAQQTADYYTSVARRQVALGRPVHVYGHPERLGPMADVVVPALARLARRTGSPALTLAGYAAFWAGRERARLTVHLDPATERVEVQTIGVPDGLDLLVDAPGTRTPGVLVVDGVAHATVPQGTTRVTPGRHRDHSDLPTEGIA